MTLEHGQGPRSLHEPVSPKLGYKDAKSERHCINSIQGDANDYY